MSLVATFSEYSIRSFGLTMTTPSCNRNKRSSDHFSDDFSGRIEGQDIDTLSGIEIQSKNFFGVVANGVGRIQFSTLRQRKF